MFKCIYPDLKTIPLCSETVTSFVIVEEPLADKWYNRVNNRPETIIVEDANKFCFDTGGMYKIGEPSIETTINGLDLSMILRHAEVAYKYCQKVMTHLDWLGDHIWLPGLWQKGIFTVETGMLIKEWLDSAYNKDDAEWEWFKFYEQFEGVKNVHVPKRQFAESDW